MKVTLESLKQQIAELLSKNMSPEHAVEVADYFVWAEASGNKTQGIVKMTGTEPIQEIVPKYDPKVERDTKLSRLIDAGANPAPLAARIGTDVAIEKAKTHGFGLVGIHNTFSSNGAQAYYVEQIAKHELVGVMCSRSPAAVAAFGGIDPVFGTNPIGFGFPTNGEPLVFDTATSAMTFYGLVLAKARGETIPEGLAIDKNGELTIDPSEAMEGAILPFDKSYKGAGFGMVVELLAGPLAASAWVDNKTFKEEWGTLIMAIDPELLVELDTFKQNVSDMVRRLHDVRVKSGEPVVLPGEHSSRLRQVAYESGTVEIDDVVAKQLGIQ